MMTPILLTTDFALAQLNAASEVCVHSVYRKTVNLLCNGRLLSLHPKNTPLSPIGMLVDMDETKFSSLAFSVHDTVSITGNGLIIGNNYFALQDVKAVKTELNPISADREEDLCKMIFAALRLLPQNTSFCDLLLGGDKYLASPVALYARDILDHSKAHLRNGEQELAADSFAKLIGLGIGLTPSGDDFLCGALAALTMRENCSDLRPFLKAQILDKLYLTNDISIEFLRCACEGHFSLSITELPLSKNADEIALSFSKIGHSSGADTLNGILFVFSQMRDCY